MSVMDAKLPSERSFGLLFAGVFALIAGYSAYKGWPSLVTVLLACVSAVFLAAALLWPGRLALLNKAWFKLGMLLGMVVSPIVIGLLFFILITPVALLTRLFGRDALRLRLHRQGSYWVERTPPGPEPNSFKNQF